MALLMCGIAEAPHLQTPYRNGTVQRAIARRIPLPHETSHIANGRIMDESFGLMWIVAGFAAIVVSIATLFLVM
jgi:hypothetical protein